MFMIILLTLLAYWTLGLIIGFVIDKFTRFDLDAFLAHWAVGLVYPVLWLLFYPVRAWYSYSQSVDYYKTNGVSRWQYILGRRVRYKRMNPIARKIWTGLEDD